MNLSFQYTSEELSPSSKTGLVRGARVVLDGTLKELHLKLRRDQIHSAFSQGFNVFLNGASLFEFGDRFDFGALQYVSSKTGLSVPVSRGDTLDANFASATRGRLVGPGTLIAVIDDGS